MKNIFKKVDSKYILLFPTIGGVEITMPFSAVDISSWEGFMVLVTDILNFLVGLSVVVAVAMIIYGGYLYITSSGDPENVSKAGKAITASVIGLVIVLSVRMILVFLVGLIS